MLEDRLFVVSELIENFRIENENGLNVFSVFQCFEKPGVIGNSQISSVPEYGCVFHGM